MFVGCNIVLYRCYVHLDLDAVDDRDRMLPAAVASYMSLNPKTPSSEDEKKNKHPKAIEHTVTRVYSPPDLGSV